MGRVEHDQAPRNLGTLIGCGIVAAGVAELLLEQRAALLDKARSLAQQPVIEGNADPVEFLQQIALTISRQLAAMRALCELGRQDSQRIDPAVGGLERDGLAIRRDQLVRERTERNDQFSERLAEARTRLKFRHAVPQHRRQPAARQPFAGSDTEATKNCARLAPAWQNVAAQIGGRPHRPENLDSRDRMGRLTIWLGCPDRFERDNLLQFCCRNTPLHRNPLLRWSRTIRTCASSLAQPYRRSGRHRRGISRVSHGYQSPPAQNFHIR